MTHSYREGLQRKPPLTLTQPVLPSRNHGLSSGRAGTSLVPKRGFLTEQQEKKKKWQRQLTFMNACATPVNVLSPFLVSFNLIFKKTL